MQQATSRHSLATWQYVLALIATSALLRLPQLLSRNLLLEGDECILGLMGLHVARGHEFPIFFYGQTYGLSIVEAPAAAVSFLIGGIGPVQLKLAMLAIWIAGTCWYFLAFARPMGHARSFWIALLLASVPAWGATSMKAWSGYLTAYAVTGLCGYVIARNDNRRAGPWGFTGVLTSVVYFAHPLWLPGLLPIVVFFLWSSRKGRFWATYLGGILVAAAPVLMAKAIWFAGAVPAWVGPTAGNPHLVASLPAVAKQISVALTGSYYFGNAVPLGPMTTTVAWIWLAVLVAVVPVQVARLLTRRYLLWSHLLFLSVLATVIANWLLLDSRDARYVLALHAPLVYLIGFELCDLVDRRVVTSRRVAAAIVLLLAVQVSSMTEFSRYSYMWWTNTADTPREGKTLQKVIGALRSRGVTHAFTINALLQWQITFYSGESVVARWKTMRERYPPYVTEVDRALANGEPVAIVGYTAYANDIERIVPDPQTIVDVDGKYLVYFGAHEDVLRKGEFELPR